MTWPRQAADQLYDEMSFTRRPEGVSLHCPDGTLPKEATLSGVRLPCSPMR